MGAALNRAVLALAAAAAIPFGLAALSAPAVAATEAAGEAKAGAVSSLVTDLHVALTRNLSSDVIAPLLERAVAQAGNVCAPLRDYQVLRGGETQTLKVKCAEQPTYELTVSLKGGVLVRGGDGSIAPIDPQDGPVTAIWGVRAERYLADEARSNHKAAPVAARSLAAVSRSAAAGGWAGQGWDAVLWAGLLLTLLLALPLLVWFRLRPSQAVGGGFTSEDKDRLMAQSAEVLPEIYQHPDGWFIVRGQRGKRRVFRTLLFAYLYRSYGVKLREVR